MGRFQPQKLPGHFPPVNQPSGFDCLQNRRLAMPTREIITIGGSAGSLDALKTVLKNLPANLPATVFVVIHLSPRAESVLAKVLGRISALPALPAREGQRIEIG